MLHEEPQIVSTKALRINDAPERLLQAAKLAACACGLTLKEYVLTVLRNAVIDSQERTGLRLYTNVEEITPPPKQKPPIFRVVPGDYRTRRRKVDLGRAKQPASTPRPLSGE